MNPNENFSASEGSPSRSESSEFRHNLIKEFREQLAGKYEVPEDAGAIVVLSAAPMLENSARDAREKTPENISRIDFAFDAWKQVAARRLGKPIEELTEGDLRNPSLPPFVLDGETEQLEPMKEIAIALGVPEEKLQLINSGNRGASHTGTQFEEVARDAALKDEKRLIFITSSYHVPRVMRTGDKKLPSEMDFDVLGVPYDQFSYDIQRKVRGEIKRIVAYSEKGDISKRLRGGDKN